MCNLDAQRNDACEDNNCYNNRLNFWISAYISADVFRSSRMLRRLIPQSNSASTCILWTELRTKKISLSCKCTRVRHSTSRTALLVDSRRQVLAFSNHCSSHLCYEDSYLKSISDEKPWTYTVDLPRLPILVNKVWNE